MPVLIASLCAIGFAPALGLVSLGRELHRDEALYRYWATYWASSGDWLLKGSAHTLDKPPLFILLLGICTRIFGTADWVVFIPNLVAGLVILVVIQRECAKLGGAVVGWSAWAVLAFAPFFQFYAFSAFTDPWLSAMTMLAVAAALEGRWQLAGILASLAMGFKQFGVYTAGAVVFLAIFSTTAPARRWEALRRSGLSLCVGLVPLAMWESLRPQPFYAWMYHAASRTPPWGEAWAVLSGRMTFWIGSAASASGLPAPVWGIAAAALFIPRPERRRWIAVVLIAAGYPVLLGLAAVAQWERYAYFILPLQVLVVIVGMGAAARVALQGRERAAGALMLVVMLTLVMRSFRKPHSPPEVSREGLSGFLASTLDRWGPPHVVVVPVDLLWEIDSRIAASGKYITREFYRKHPKVLDNLMVRYATRPLVVVGADPELCEFSDGAFSAWWLRNRWSVGPVRRMYFPSTRASRVGTTFFVASVPARVPREISWADSRPGCTPLASFKCGAELLDLRMSEDSAGTSIALRWRCATPPTYDWTVGLQIREPGGRRLATLDHQPADGWRPMTGWNRDDVIAYRISWPAGVPMPTEGYFRLCLLDPILNRRDGVRGHLLRRRIEFPLRH